ncbi:rhodanese-like domain-containing protein [Candidatus Parcubacteria bacterium]|nr:MAG: rhodanese-like domain-containing protein [Candidatus Parcubacteria bacterium]
MKNTYVIVGPTIASIVVTVLAIYLTPLKNLNIIQPVTNDIDPVEFWTDYRANPDNYLFIDVRQVADYEENHAQGSVNIPIQKLFERHGELPKKGKTIVLICTGGSLSGVAYGYLEHQGFLNLRRIEGGLRNWMIEGLPIENARTQVNE